MTEHLDRTLCALADIYRQQFRDDLTAISAL